jgi:hypothetical protein
LGGSGLGGQDTSATAGFGRGSEGLAERTSEHSSRSEELSRDTENWSQGGGGDLGGRRANLGASGNVDPSVGGGARAGLGTSGGPGNTATADTAGLGGGHRGTASGGAGQRDTDFGPGQTTAQTKPGIGQRVAGSAEKTMDKVTGNQARVERGVERQVSGLDS